MDINEAEAYGIFFGCGQASRHELKTGVHFTWVIENSVANLKYIRQLFTEIYGNDIQFDINLTGKYSGGGAYMTIPQTSPRWDIIRRQYYEAFYDEWGQKRFPRQIVESNNYPIMVAFLKGITNTRLINTGDSELLLQRTLYKDFYTIMKTAKRYFQCDSSDYDDDVLEVKF